MITVLHPDGRVEKIDELLAIAKELAFVAESVAHLRGLERELLPLTDRAREVIKQAESV